ncbi:MAG: sulfatase-like hydrolase/transferase, partial [Achromobacter piechaudii]
AKLHPKDGYERHPWVQAYAEFERSEETFQDEDERVNAFLAYYGLCSFLDSNVGRIVDELAALGLADSTHVVYTSDHGDNVGARGLWGKSTLYQESVGIPMILAGPDVTPSVCETAVDLLDLYPTLLQAVGVDPAPHQGTRPGKSLFDIARQPVDANRAILSEYHAAGSNTAGFMLRKGPWKYHHYVRFQPELFNLESDPGELHDLAGDPAYAGVLADMKTALYAICNPEDVDRQAKADQAAMIERLGGPEAASMMGASGATPAPKVEQAA